MKFRNRIKENLNNKGATLTFAILGLMIVAISVAGLVMTSGGFMQRVLNIHHDRQVYLSARSAAEALAAQIADDSYHRIMSLDVSERVNMENLPFEMQTGASSTVVLSNTQKALIESMEGLLENEEIDLGTIKFNNSPSKVSMGTVTATLTRIEGGYYIVSATAELDDEIETVRTVLSAYGYETEEDEERIPEIIGNWEGFFMDYGFDLGTDGSLVNSNGNGDVAVTVPIYENTIIGGVYSNSDIIMVDGVKQNGVLMTSALIYLEDMEVKGEDSYIYAGEGLTMVGEMLTSVTIESPLIKVLGDGATLQGGTNDQEIICETMIIEGNDITISAPITCEELYITGDNINVTSSVIANKVYLVGGEINVFEITSIRVYVEEGTTNLYQRDITTLDGYALYGEEHLLVLKGEHEEFKYNIITDPDLEEVEFLLSEYNPVTRSQPIWADYDPLDLKLFDMEEIEGSWFGSTEIVKMTTGYYFIDKELVDPVELTSQFTIMEDVIERTETWNRIKIDQYIDRTDISVDEPLVIVVRDGQNLLVENGGGIHVSHLYFILEGNAKIQLPSGMTKARIYGEAPTVRIDAEINEAIDLVVQEAINLADGDFTQIDYDLAKDKVRSVMNYYYEDISMIIAQSGATLVGNAIIPYIMTDDDDFTWQFIEYEGPTLEFEDFATGVLTTSQVNEQTAITQQEVTSEMSQIEMLRTGYATTVSSVLDEYTLFEFVGYIK